MESNGERRSKLTPGSHVPSRRERERERDTVFFILKYLVSQEELPAQLCPCGSPLTSAHVTLLVKLKDDYWFSPCEKGVTNCLVFVTGTPQKNCGPRQNWGWRHGYCRPPSEGAECLFPLSLREARTFCFALEALACTVRTLLLLIFRLTFPSEPSTTILILETCTSSPTYALLVFLCLEGSLFSYYMPKFQL